MKRRRLKNTWKIDEKGFVTNELGDNVGRALLDKDGEYYLTKKPLRTFNSLLNTLQSQ